MGHRKVKLGLLENGSIMIGTLTKGELTDAFRLVAKPSEKPGDFAIEFINPFVPYNGKMNSALDRMGTRAFIAFSSASENIEAKYLELVTGVTLPQRKNARGGKIVSANIIDGVNFKDGK